MDPLVLIASTSSSIFILISHVQNWCSAGLQTLQCAHTPHVLLFRSQGSDGGRKGGFRILHLGVYRIRVRQLLVAVTADWNWPLREVAWQAQPLVYATYAEHLAAAPAVKLQNNHTTTRHLTPLISLQPNVRVTNQI